jgi:hypothetical protein
MITSRWNITVKRGATHDVTMTLTVDDATLPLVGYTARMQVRDTPHQDGTLLTELSTSNGMLIIDGAAGTIRRLLTAAQTQALAEGSYFYDLKLTSGSGAAADYHIEGPFTVEDSVTS